MIESPGATSGSKPSEDERGRASVSVAMIVCNEEKNLERTLEALAWADELVLVDSGSTDATAEIAQRFGAQFTVHRDFRGHGEQKNVAIDRCTSEWIFLVDADEVPAPELRAEIQRTLENPQYDAYWVPRRNLFLNRWMRHGGLYPDRKLRLFRQGAARLEEGVGPHATPQHTGPKGKLRHPLLHYAYPDFQQYLEHMNRYSGEVAAGLVRKGKGSGAGYFLRAFFNPGAGFLHNYVIRGGFLDGWQGLVFHVNHAAYVHWKYIKAWRMVCGRKTG
jgi:glycosyltransferase involved in cell wall biosynthesis